MYTTVGIGGGPKGGPGDHAQFLATLERPGFDERELRFGPVNGGVLGGFIPKPGDSFSNNTNSDVIKANTWTCVEWAIVKNSSFDKMYGWVDGKQVLKAESSSDWQNTTPKDFVVAPFTNYISFGWRAFGNSANVKDLWFDDIVVSNKRVGCN